MTEEDKLDRAIARQLVRRFNLYDLGQLRRWDLVRAIRLAIATMPPPVDTGQTPGGQEP